LIGFYGEENKDTTNIDAVSEALNDISNRFQSQIKLQESEESVN
jgi:hypothetical protein